VKQEPIEPQLGENQQQPLEDVDEAEEAAPPPPPQQPTPPPSSDLPPTPDRRSDGIKGQHYLYHGEERIWSGRVWY